MERRKEARGQPDGNRIRPQVKGAGNRSRATTRDNQEQLRKGSGWQDGPRQVCQDVAREHMPRGCGSLWDRGQPRAVGTGLLS